MKKDLLVILLLCFLGFTLSSCDDSSEPENGGEVEQTAPDWTIGTWETTADVVEETYQREFEITENSFQWVSANSPVYIFDKEETIENDLGDKNTIKFVVAQRTTNKFVLDAYINGEKSPHFGLENDGDKFYYRDWDMANKRLTTDRWEVVKK